MPISSITLPSDSRLISNVRGIPHGRKNPRFWIEATILKQQSNGRCYGHGKRWKPSTLGGHGLGSWKCFRHMTCIVWDTTNTKVKYSEPIVCYLDKSHSIIKVYHFAQPLVHWEGVQPFPKSGYFVQSSIWKVRALMKPISIFPFCYKPWTYHRLYGHGEQAPAEASSQQGSSTKQRRNGKIGDHPWYQHMSSHMSF